MIQFDMQVFQTYLLLYGYPSHSRLHDPPAVRGYPQTGCSCKSAYEQTLIKDEEAIHDFRHEHSIHNLRGFKV